MLDKIRKVLANKESTHEDFNKIFRRIELLISELDSSSHKCIEFKCLTGFLNKKCFSSKVIYSYNGPFSSQSHIHMSNETIENKRCFLRNFLDSYKNVLKQFEKYIDYHTGFERDDYIRDYKKVKSAFGIEMNMLDKIRKVVDDEESSDKDFNEIFKQIDYFLCGLGSNKNGWLKIFFNIDSKIDNDCVVYNYMVNWSLNAKQDFLLEFLNNYNPIIGMIKDTIRYHEDEILKNSKSLKKFKVFLGE